MRIRSALAVLLALACIGALSLTSPARAAGKVGGDVRVDLWPSWATTVTTLDPRLTITVDESAGDATEGPAASAGATPARPSSSPRPSAARSTRPASSGGASAAP